jgi:putative nucleotidyltransferase with HDIG domain
VPGEKEISGEALTDLMTQSLKFSDRLHSRQKILEGLSKAPEGPKEVTDLVVSDPSLTGHILRTVNSPFYGLVKPVGSVFRAVLLLGHLEVRNIVWRTCLAEAVDEGSIPPDQLETLWQHAAATSRIAYAVAKSTGLHNPDEISTAALLHDVGKLIFLDLWPQRANPFCHPGHASDHALLIAEEDEFGIGHARLAAELAQSWSLPEDVGSMIENHHLPSYRPPSEVSGNLRAIAAVHVADLLSHISNRYLSGADVPSVYLPAPGWLRLLGAGDDLSRICTETVVRSLVHPNLEGDRAGQPTSAA